ncbi:hypothetical protein ACM26V_16280 [Salipaludibacillus sp. HK11]|uniref:hypothetical protein n=1 Tax=Salipaludibacillus sp. HK11 TaxID=3394320 RepID=UPI0039FD03B5
MISLSIVLFLITACNNPKLPEENENVRGQAAQYQNQLRQGMAKTDEWMENIFEDGLTNYTGEGFPSVHVPEENAGDYQLVIENIIYDIPGVTPGQVIVVGERAWVNVSFERELTEPEAAEQIANIKEQLNQAIPNLHYEVIINEFI